MDGNCLRALRTGSVAVYMPRRRARAHARGGSRDPPREGAPKKRGAGSAPPRRRGIARARARRGGRELERSVARLLKAVVQAEIESML